MKKILLFILIFIPMLIAAGTVVPAGPVSGNWDLSGSPYSVTGDIYVEETATLLIDAGVQVLFTGWFKFEVFGSLMAQGETLAEIHFSGSDFNIKWRGIRFMETTASSLLDYCVVEHALSDLGMYTLPNNCGGGILCYQSPNASIIISNSKIQYNKARHGGGIMVWNSKPVIENCEIRFNEAWRGAGIELFEHANAKILKSNISHNNALANGGGLMISSCHDIFIKGNQIASNTGESGAGMYITNTHGNFCGNTLTNNVSSADGGGIFFHIGASPTMVNNIIYFNTDGSTKGGNQVYINMNNSDPNFNYCNIYGGVEGFEGLGAGINFNGEYNDCIDGDPLFEDFAAGNFTVSWDNYPYEDDTKSPCIDNGCPMQGNDPDNSCCDIGSSSFFQILDIPVDLYGEVYGPLKYHLSWAPAYGALGYYLDVAYTPLFNTPIVENKLVEGTDYWVKLYEPYPLFFRVRSFNTALTSDYSEIHPLMGLSVDENEADAVKIYSSANGLHINTNESILSSGEVWIYNISGQLIGHHKLTSGLNTIEPGVSQQIVIVKAMVDGNVYQQKLLLH